MSGEFTRIGNFVPILVSTTAIAPPLLLPICPAWNPLPFLVPRILLKHQKQGAEYRDPL
jgi:hypothetical protein